MVRPLLTSWPVWRETFVFLPSKFSSPNCFWYISYFLGLLRGRVCVFNSPLHILHKDQNFHPSRSRFLLSLNTDIQWVYLICARLLWAGDPGWETPESIIRQGVWSGIQRAREKKREKAGWGNWLWAATQSIQPPPPWSCLSHGCLASNSHECIFLFVIPHNISFSSAIICW